MSHAPNYTPAVSFATEETNQAAGRSTLRTTAVDIELANISSSINALNNNIKNLQRDDGKPKDFIVEPYALSEQARALIASGGIPKGIWNAASSYNVGDAVTHINIAYLCITSHTSASVFDYNLWMAISGDGSSATSAITAAASAAAAAASAASALSAAVTATTKATEASASAVTATTKATEAANSASTAENNKVATNSNVIATASNASAAAASQAAAAASAAAAALSYDNFDDRWLGNKSSAPTLDNDGNPLQIGAAYFNTTTGDMYVRTAAATWVTINNVTSATNAANSASAAAASAAAATAAETLATASKTSAAISETNADISETNAANSATASASSATYANTSAAAALISENNATASANSATASASSAANNAASAAASYDAFDDRFLGAKASPPATDNDGNALLVGALYWNTTLSKLYIWAGSTWNQGAFDATGAVLSFNARTGAVTLSSTDVIDALTFVPQSQDADLDWLAANITTAGKAILNDVDAAAQRVTLGLGLMAIQDGRYTSKIITVNTTLAVDSEYETGRNFRVNHGATLTIPASTKLIVRHYAAGLTL